MIKDHVQEGMLHMLQATTRTVRRRLLAASLAFTACLAMLIGASHAGAVTYKVCQGGPPGYQAGGAYCNLGSSIPLDSITETANDGSIAVYRATASYLGAPSASGTEYWGGGLTFTQSFHCNAGYPAEHNRHSYQVFISIVDAYDCT